MNVKIFLIILRKISLKLGYSYFGVGNFIKKLNKLEIHKKFILYHDIIKLNKFIEILKNSKNYPTSEIAKSIFIITRDILKKVEIRHYEKENKRFREDVRKNRDLNNFLINENNKDKELEELKSVVENLFNLQKKQ